MKKLLPTIIIVLFFIQISNSQIPTWSDDIAPLIYKNCAVCHHNGAIAPFELMTFQDVVLYAPLIHEAIEHREMPPWPADPNYRRFAHETYLEDEEILAIHDWIDAGMPLGNPDDAPEPPLFLPGGSLLDTIDYVVEIEPYTLQYDVDEYRWFVIPTNFPDTVYISRIEVIAGLDQVVHHADLSFDLTGHSKALDLQDPLPGFNNSTGAPNYDYYINAWQPGGNIPAYPENWGIAVPPGADFVIEIHYGPGGIGLIDSTKMNLQFIKNPTGVRPVNVAWILTDSPPVLVDGPLVLPPNEISTFHQKSYPVWTDLSLIAICPHMHFLGKSYKVWAETPMGVIIPLIDIPHWDFHWQKYYYFQQVQKIPQGSILHSEGVYDNTVDNHDNPNNPPITVNRGFKTTDEMFLCYFIFAEYQNGDEQIIQDSTLMVNSTEILSEENDLTIFPNPVENELYIYGTLPSPEKLSFRIVDLKGIEVKRWEMASNNTLIQENIELSKLSSGLYYLEWFGEKFKGTSSFVKQ